MNILITGITGFFGRNFTQYLLNHDFPGEIIGTAHSECKLAHFKNYFRNIKTYVIDLSSERIEDDLESIIVSHRINYIVHAAAMKHVDICQENPMTAYRVNTVASDILIKLAKKNNVKNLIALSTDKTNNPCNTYGIVKYIMQENVLTNGFSVYQGANFFWSDGSALDIWFNQYIKKKPLTVRDLEHIRYFNTIDHVCEIIYKNLDQKHKVILPDHVYLVRIKDLLGAFKNYFKYDQIQIVGAYEYEKKIEILRDEVTNIINLDLDQITKLIDEFYQNML